MDQQTRHDVLDVRTPQTGSGVSVAPGFAGAAPYSPFTLALSVIVILGLTAIFAAILAGMFIAATIAVLGWDEARSFYLSLQFDIPTKTKLSAGSVTIVYTALAGAIVCVARYKSRAGWRDLLALTPLGWGWRRNGSVAVMVLIYAALATLALARLRERHVPLDGPTDKLLVGLLVTNYVLFAPIAEELLFRGWLYTGLRRRFRFGTALFATSFLFAAIHWEPRHMVLVLPLAFALGFIREQTGSIKPTIALHASYNMIIVVITLMTQ